MQRAKLAQAEALRGLLRPFQRAGENVQPNLVTQDGELAQEVKRMKELVVKVGDKMRTGQGRRGPQNPERVGNVDAGAKIDAILAARPVELHGD